MVFGKIIPVFSSPKSDAIFSKVIMRLWKDKTSRQKSNERGHQNVARYSWERTARLFRAHYRRIAQRLLAEEDNTLLTSPPLM